MADSPKLTTPVTPTPGNRPHLNGLRRAFTVPNRIREQASTKQEQYQVNGRTVEVLYLQTRTRLISFTPVALSQSSDLDRRGSQPQIAEAGSLSWGSWSEETLGYGELRVYIAPPAIAFLSAGNYITPILPKTQCWCVDGISKFVIPIRENCYCRIELPNDVPDDAKKVEEFKVIIGKQLKYERTPCPFKRSFSVELPPQEEAPKQIPWKPRTKPGPKDAEKDLKNPRQRERKPSPLRTDVLEPQIQPGGTAPQTAIKSEQVSIPVRTVAAENPPTPPERIVPTLARRFNKDPVSSSNGVERKSSSHNELATSEQTSIAMVADDSMSLPDKDPPEESTMTEEMTETISPSFEIPSLTENVITTPENNAFAPETKETLLTSSKTPSPINNGSTAHKNNSPTQKTMETLVLSSSNSSSGENVIVTSDGLLAQVTGETVDPKPNIPSPIINGITAPDSNISPQQILAPSQSSSSISSEHENLTLSRSEHSLDHIPGAAPILTKVEAARESELQTQTMPMPTEATLTEPQKVRPSLTLSISTESLGILDVAQPAPNLERVTGALANITDSPPTPIQVQPFQISDSSSLSESDNGYQTAQSDADSVDLASSDNEDMFADDYSATPRSRARHEMNADSPTRIVDERPPSLPALSRVGTVNSPSSRGLGLASSFSSSRDSFHSFHSPISPLPPSPPDSHPPSPELLLPPGPRHSRENSEITITGESSEIWDMPSCAAPEKALAEVEAEETSRCARLSTLHRTLSPMPSASNLVMPPAKQAGDQPFLLLQKSCTMLLQPPIYMVRLMLVVAARIAAGVLLGREWETDATGRKVDIEWDLRGSGRNHPPSSLARSRARGKAPTRDLDIDDISSSSEDSDDEDEDDDFGVPLQSPRRRLAQRSHRDRDID